MGSGTPVVEIANEADRFRFGSAAKEVDRLNHISGRIEILGRFAKGGIHIQFHHSLHSSRAIRSSRPNCFISNEMSASVRVLGLDGILNVRRFDPFPN
jgi:hypothetical protein